jgi:hypothetical protein
LDDLVFQVNYLGDKGYLEQLRLNGEGFLARITSHGIDLVENNAEFNAKFPSIQVTNINNSKGVVMGSNNVKLDFNESLNITESFNNLYNLIDPSDVNSDVIKEKLKHVESELNKEVINKSVLNSSMEWLKINAQWTIPMLTQIIMTVIMGKG